MLQIWVGREGGREGGANCHSNVWGPQLRWEPQTKNIICNYRICLHMIIALVTAAYTARPRTLVTKMMFWTLAGVTFSAAKIVSCNKIFFFHSLPSTLLQLFYFNNHQYQLAGWLTAAEFPERKKKNLWSIKKKLKRSVQIIFKKMVLDQDRAKFDF
jgi:hypothetical protein